MGNNECWSQMEVSKCADEHFLLLMKQNAPKARKFCHILKIFHKKFKLSCMNVRIFDEIMKFCKRCQKCQKLTGIFILGPWCQIGVLKAKRCQTGIVGCQMATLHGSEPVPGWAVRSAVLAGKEERVWENLSLYLAGSRRQLGSSAWGGRASQLVEETGDRGLSRRRQKKVRRDESGRLEERKSSNTSLKVKRKVFPSPLRSATSPPG